jgi:hypothetical protein
MKVLPKALEAITLISVGAFAGSLVAPMQVDGAGSAPVTVTNTPLPVAVQGTANVNVTNSSLQISGTPTVKLDATGNTVKIDQSANTVSLGATDSAHLANTDTATGKLNFDGNGNLKTTGAASALVATHVLVFGLGAGANSSASKPFGGTINVSSIVVRGDAFTMSLKSNGTAVMLLFGNGAGDEIISLPAAIPADEFVIDCGTATCGANVSIAGT